MSAVTTQTINELASERSQLYRLAGNGLADAAARKRITEITGQLTELWEARRQAMAGHRYGIDLLVEQEYARIYGKAFEDAVKPAAVAEAEDEPVALAAA